MPAHEIETLIGKTVRGEIFKLSGEEDGVALEHLLKHQETTPAYTLILACVERITIGFDCLSIRFELNNEKFPCKYPDCWGFPIFEEQKIEA